MALRVVGRLDWGGGRDQEMHRNYWIKFLVESSSSSDGPQSITFASGLPAVGAPWTYGNDNDAYALCLPTITCETVIKNEPNFHWILKYDFTTRPWRACASTQITTPVSQPDQISGSFISYQEKVCKRRDGKPIISSSLEPIWVPRDKNRPTVSITQTGINLGLPVFSQMIDTVNDSPMWGLAKRTVKLRNVPWRRLVWGLCTYYYQRTLEFEVKYETWDETEVADVGHRVIDPAKLIADPSLDRTDPSNFTRTTDDRGNVNKAVLLSNGTGCDTGIGKGQQCTSPAEHTHVIPTVELYNESNFFLLGIPSSL